MNVLEKKYAEIEDPGIRNFLIEGEKFHPASAIAYSIAEQRAFYNRYCAHFRQPRPPGVTATDAAIANVPCRRYRRRGSDRAPVLLYLHGGGLAVGGLDSHDDICAELCNGAVVEVVAVDYRLAPEHPFPAALDDCFAVLTELLGAGRHPIVAGDSGGGCLAAAAALSARDQGLPLLAGQVLVYASLGGDPTRGSYVSQAHAPGLSTADVVHYRKNRMGHDLRYAAPLLEIDFRHLPPAFLVAAGIDPVHDDSFDYALRLRAAGIAAKVRDEPLLVHAFLRARHMSAPARESFAAIVEAVRSLAYEGRLPSP
jgi:acetyl esterase